MFKIEWGYTVHIMKPNHICGWCKKELPQIIGLKPGDVSHGICPKCYAEKMKELDEMEVDNDRV